MPQTTYCVECDAPPGQCEHTGPRYLDEITYERTTEGWRVPDHERERWNSDRWVGKGKAPTTTAPSEPMMFRELIDVVEKEVFLDPALRTLLIDCYDVSATKTTRVVENFHRNAHQLNNPGGLLVTRLRQILNP